MCKYCGDFWSRYAEEVKYCADEFYRYKTGCCNWGSKGSRKPVTTQPQSSDYRLPFQNESEQSRQDRERLQSENDELRARLGQIISAQMTDNNPNVVNLGDTNRPDKLRDRYSELYDNEWTDAYNALKEDGLSIEQAINDLLNILMTSYKLSQEKARRQLESLSCFGGMDKLPVEVAKGLKESRKVDSTYKNQIPEVEKEVIRHLAFKSDIKEPVRQYLHECVSLTWLMAIQDPPMVLDDPIQVVGKPFNKNIYKEYLNAGVQVKFVVWPAMFMNAGGSLAKKGVAEGHDPNKNQSDNATKYNTFNLASYM